MKTSELLNELRYYVVIGVIDGLVTSKEIDALDKAIVHFKEVEIAESVSRKIIREMN